MSNQRKYLSHREAWARIDAAIEARFPFEAVTICESLIADRLLSYLRGVSQTPEKFTTRTPFKRLIDAWRKAAGSLLLVKNEDLGRSLDAWRDRRNEVVHGLARSMPGEPTSEVIGFMTMANDAAEEGRRLAKLVKAWHQKALRESNSLDSQSLRGAQ